MCNRSIAIARIEHADTLETLSRIREQQVPGSGAEASNRARRIRDTIASGGDGTRTGVSIPARSARVRRTASRRSVLTLSEAPFGTSDGAITSHATPIEASSRCSSYPDGPAS
jgi:hypothetical protein